MSNRALAYVHSKFAAQGPAFIRNVRTAWNLTNFRVIGPVVRALLPGLRTARSVMVPVGPGDGVRCLLLCADALAPASATVTPTVVLHLHGGGFVAMDPESHESYLRRWATKISSVAHAPVPIVSVDYTLSPEVQYPTALDEAEAVFEHLLSDGAAATFGITGVRNIVVTGDSAGGTLTSALAVRRLTKRGAVAPSALVLTYPTMVRGVEKVPSKIRFAHDAIIPAVLARSVNVAYVPASQSDHSDPCLSPLFTPASVLARFPPVRIVCGSKDPLIGDSQLFHRRLKAAGASSELTVLDDMPHGFLNMAMFSVDAREGVRLIGDRLGDAVRASAI